MIEVWIDSGVAKEDNLPRGAPSSVAKSLYPATASVLSVTSDRDFGGWNRRACPYPAPVLFFGLVPPSFPCDSRHVPGQVGLQQCGPGLAVQCSLQFTLCKGYTGKVLEISDSCIQIIHLTRFPTDEPLLSIFHGRRHCCQLC